ncbi:MAG TPA: methionyl-tRNA formyltransferase [Sedimentisphaerales bacterium]|nr:methionyl-tRNA formyltransferase [Sedimentisphaerales bacterium]
MKVVYLGSGDFGIESLNALAGSTHSLCFIVTQPTQPAGRGRKTRPTPAARWAAQHSIPFIETDNVNASAIAGKIAEFGPDVIVVIAFGQKIGHDVINLPPKGAINVHASLLPKYRGAAPINWAVINGETQTGISIIRLAEKMDAGDILAQAKTHIGPDETAGELHDRLAQIAAPLLLETLNQINAGTVVYTRQDHSSATLAPKLKKSDGFLDFAESAETLRKKILGLWPWPGASATYMSKKTMKSQRVTIAAARTIETSNPSGLPAGTLDENLNVICGQNALRITRLKPAGSPLMDFEAFVNGRQTRPGDLFVKLDD